MKNSEVRVVQVKNGFLITFMDPVVNRKGAGELVERQLVIEEEAGNGHRKAFKRLIDFLMDYYQVTYTRDIKIRKTGVTLRADKDK